jgi:hypothetical protein
MRTNAVLSFGFVLAAACGGSDTTYDDVATGVSGLISDQQGGDAQLFADAMLSLQGTVPIQLTRGALDVEINLDADGSRVNWKTKGSIEQTRYKLELDRRGDWTISDRGEEVAKINGTSDAEVKSSLKDRETDEKRKYRLDYHAEYRDIEVRTVDNAAIGGELELKLKVKATEKDSFEKIKEELEVKARITFEADGSANIELDEKYKYKLKVVSGELETM